jgi:hypothetical protein
LHGRAAFSVERRFSHAQRLGEYFESQEAGRAPVVQGVAQRLVLSEAVTLRIGKLAANVSSNRPRAQPASAVEGMASAVRSGCSGSFAVSCICSYAPEPG